MGHIYPANGCKCQDTEDTILSSEQFLVLCIPRDFCDPEAYGPFSSRSDAMIYMNKNCPNKHRIIVVRSPE